MKKAALTHPKMYALASRLGVSLSHAAGILEYLHAFTGDHAPGGDVGKWPDGAIARACHWLDDPTDFVRALIECRWVDECQVNRLVVHDWEGHCERWVKAKVKELGLQFVTRTVVATVVATTGGATSPLLSSPSLSSPNLTTPIDIPKGISCLPAADENENASRTPAMPAAPNGAFDTGRDATAIPPEANASKLGGRDNGAAILAVFEHYRKQHPLTHKNPNSKMKEWVLIRQRLSEGYTVEDLCAAIDGCHRSPFHCGENQGGQKYQSLKLIVRDSSQVQHFLEIPEAGAPVLSEKTRQGLRAGSQWADREAAKETGR